ncbi:hypothetical protein K7432_016164 [Basidiobolus ranarum]|uniref:Uncharacterized protein n=1 Tax=Basidiobolus ranarum TaxID=34480 RepID=A0ABR2WF86_9FUNG
MDSDWCTVCGKHVETSGQLYCNQTCRQKDQQSDLIVYEKHDGATPVPLIERFSCPLKQQHLRYHIEYHASKEHSPPKVGYPFHLKLYKKSTAFRPVDLRLLSLTKKYPSIQSGRPLLTVAQ